MLTNSLLFSIVRGWDATGIAGVREIKEQGKTYSEIRQYKRALTAYDFLDTKQASRLMDRLQEFYYVIGHVRASTMGAKDDANAHPFQYAGPAGDITLVHNGTINKSILPVKPDEFIDSAHIACHMAEHGEIPTLEKLDGGFSLVWYNQTDDSLNFARNDKKPMALAFSERRNELFYMSEYTTLNAVLDRNGVDLDGPLFVTRPYVHYKFRKEDLRAYSRTTFKAYVPPTYDNRWQNNRPPVVIHPPRSTGTHTPALVTDAKILPQSGSKTTTGTQHEAAATTGNKATLSINTPSAERIKTVNKALEPYELEIGASLVLKAVAWHPSSNTNSHLGRLILESYDTKEDLSYVMYNVEEGWAEDKIKKVRTAVKIRNMLVTADPQNQSKTVVVSQEPGLQAIIDRSPEGVFDAPKEDPKSNGDTVSVTIDMATGEVLGEEAEEIFPESVPGPYGSKITMEQYKELAERDCCWCTGDTGLDNPSLVGWYNGEIVCGFCWADPKQKKERMVSH